jgi:hypothetical protein
MEVPMTMHDNHHITDAEDVAFDATMKMVGMGIVLVMIAGMVLGYKSRHVRSWEPCAPHQRLP